MHLYNYNVLCINNHSKAIGFITLMQMSVFKILIHSINKQYSTDEGATDLETYTNVLTSQRIAELSGAMSRESIWLMLLINQYLRFL